MGFNLIKGGGRSRSSPFSFFSTKGIRDNNLKSKVENRFRLEDVNPDFLYWFSGFTDAEGNFLITLDRNYVKFRFKISLHIDDVEVLNTIKSNLGIGNIVIENSRNRCSFVIERYEDIKDVICVIFKNFPLHTSKKLDFEDFYQAVLVKDKKNLSNAELDRILSLKNGMNSKREKFTYFTTDSQIIINPNGFIGF